MTIVYCDLVSGNDTTGDGTYSLPYLTLTKSDDGLTGGDEIRVAKTARTTLAGTLSFTEGSASVTTTSDLSSTLALNDVISKDDGADEGWWHVLSVTSDTITLSNLYYGSTESGVTGYYMTPGSTVRQTVAVHGTSTSSRLKVTGGWDLSTQTRDGYTCYSSDINFQATLTTTTYTYIEVSYFILLALGEYTYPFTLSGTGNYIHHMHSVNHADGEGSSMTGNYITGEYITATGGDGFGIKLGNYSQASNIYVYSSPTGIQWTSDMYAVLSDFVVKGCITQGVYLYQYCGAILIKDGTVDDCGKGIYYYYKQGANCVSNCTISNCTTGLSMSQCETTQVLNDVTLSSNTNDYGGLFSYFTPSFRGTDSSGVHFSVYAYQTVSEDTTDARSGSCIKLTPSSAQAYFSPLIKVGVVEITSAASDLTLSVYMKDDSSFNGVVRLSATVGGLLVNYDSSVTMTTSYVQQSLVIDSADLVVGEYAILSVHVDGTAGNVFVDDFSYSQA